MKNILNFLLVLMLLIAAGCEKEKVKTTEVEGKWELVKLQGSPMYPNEDVPPGSGMFFSFSGNKYERTVNFAVVETGTFTMSQQGAEIDGIKYQYELFFSADGSNGASKSIHLHLSGNTLIFSAGAMVDWKTAATYKKI